MALSRARQGMYIFGDADLLSSRSNMWKTVIEELDGQGCLGHGIPITCHRHPENHNIATRPGQIRLIAPDGVLVQ